MVIFEPTIGTLLTHQPKINLYFKKKTEQKKTPTKIFLGWFCHLASHMPKSQMGASCVFFTGEWMQRALAYSQWGWYPSSGTALLVFSSRTSCSSKAKALTSAMARNGLSPPSSASDSFCWNSEGSCWNGSWTHGGGEFKVQRRDTKVVPQSFIGVKLWELLMSEGAMSRLECRNGTLWF